MGKLIIGDTMINLKRLKDIREDNDMKQQDIAQILNVNRGTYSLWELGTNIIPLHHLCNYADYFNVSIDYVLNLTNDKSIKINKGLDLKVLGSNIRKIRVEHNLSQENIATLLGVTQACVARYEKGLICISTLNLFKFAKEFEVSLSEICGKTKA